MSVIRRIGPGLAKAPNVNRRASITDARELATFFLWSVEQKTERASDYEDDPRVDPVVAALARLDIHTIDRVLGAGSFGVASLTLRGQVLKLTSDPAEVKVGAHLIGNNLPHVVNMYGSWFIRDVYLSFATKVDANGSPIFEKYQAGILIEQEVDKINRGLSKELSQFVMVWKDDTGNHPKDYEHLPYQEKRERLRRASIDLEANLREESNMFDNLGVGDSSNLFRDVANALSELRDVGIYAIDVHGGNVGLDVESGDYRVFDVGVGSPPPGGREPEVIDVPPPGRPTRPEGHRRSTPPPPQRPAPLGPEPEQISMFREGRGGREGLGLAEAVAPPVVVGEL